MTDESNINIEDDLPLAVRRKRRGSSDPASLQDSQFKNRLTSTQPHGPLTPPVTPHRSKKRVKFSDPGPSSSTGLTPLLSRNSLLTPPKPKPHQDSPSSQSSSRLNSSSDNSTVLSGTLQFEPYREVLDERTRRALRRSGLSEVTNAYELEKRLEKKARKTEIERLQEEVHRKNEEVRQKDEEIADLKSRQNIESLGGVECDDGIILISAKDHEVDTENSDLSHSSTHQLSSPLLSDTMPRTPSKSAENFRLESTNTLLGESPLRENTIEEDSIEDNTMKDGSTQRAFNGGIAKRLLLGRGSCKFGPVSQSRELLLQASEKGDEEAVQMLLSRYNIDLNITCQNDRTPLMMAAENGHEAVVQVLLRHEGFSPDLTDYDGRTALWFAAQKGHQGVVQQLLEQKYVDVNTIDYFESCTPLMVAVQNKHEKVVQVLLGREDVNPNLLDKNGETPLWHAVKHRSTMIVKLLLERHDVDVSTKNRRGESILWFAASLGYTAIVELLLGRDNIDPNAKSNEQLTPLMAAARGGHEEVVQLLLKRDRVRTDICDLTGWTALTYAALHGHDQVVRLLLKHGVNAESIDSTLQMVSRLVREPTWQEVVIQLLREYQA
jgi:ankyrin repeat protein